MSRFCGLTGFSLVALLLDVTSSGSVVIWGLDQATASKTAHLSVWCPRPGLSLRSSLSLWVCPSCLSSRVAGLPIRQLRAPESMKEEATRPRNGLVSRPSYSIVKQKDRLRFKRKVRNFSVGTVPKNLRHFEPILGGLSKQRQQACPLMSAQL